jgi:hypothetical protein
MNSDDEEVNDIKIVELPVIELPEGFWNDSQPILVRKDGKIDGDAIATSIPTRKFIYNKKNLAMSYGHVIYVIISCTFSNLGSPCTTIFPVGPTECSCEDLFSVGGRICSKLRSNLTQEHLEQLSCNYYWKREEVECHDRKGEKSLTSSNKFTSLSIARKLIPPTETPKKIW